MHLFSGHNKSLDEFSYSDVDIGDIMTSCTRNVSYLGLSGHVEFDSSGEPRKNVKIDQIQSMYISLYGLILVCSLRKVVYLEPATIRLG